MRAYFILENVKGKTLDVGYACGTLHERIMKKVGKKNCFGIDTEEEIKDEMHKKASAEKIPFKDNFFECIVAGELIEHLKKPRLFLEESARVLKKGGRIIITTPNKDSLINRIFHSYEAPLHISLFNKKSLKEALEKKGFKIIEWKFFPFTEESNYGSRNKWSFKLRKLIHKILPDSLREDMGVIAEKI